ncbi:hypothetical protein Taro_012792 [Colocasia esculenta]|uniref:Uncharacterized protein n=1 Tax=Colocasia esculenta TaxID=4460 RepID=A0A843UEJ1_COLES|nr:hypothetical protein [Colocasia esculenta]
MGRREMATNLHNNESESGGQSRGKHAYKWVCLLCDQSRMEKELKRPPTFQEVFDKTHKKKELYSHQMTEKYTEEEEQPQLDLEVWVAASGAPKKGHAYGFGHNMDTSRVLSSASSSASLTSAFTTPAAPGTPSEMMGFILDMISGLKSHLAQTMESRAGVDAIQAQLSQALSQAISQALSQAISQALS